MTTKPYLDERRLSRALTSQGFRLEPTTKGIRVLAPDGKGSTSWHSSVFDEANRTSYANLLAQLARIGFDLKRGDETRDDPDAPWRAERAASEVLFEDPPKPAAKVEAPVNVRIAALSPDSRRLYQMIASNPGLTPAEYRAIMDEPSLPHMWLINHAHSLIRLGLVEQTGQRRGLRYWVAGQIGTADPVTATPSNGAKATKATMRSDGQPSAGPVRVRHQEPADPVVKMRHMGEKAARLHADLGEVLTAMVETYAAQEAEVVALREKVDRLESVLTKAIDAL